MTHQFRVTRYESAGQGQAEPSALLDPHRQMSGLERGVHHVGQLIADRAQVHGVLQPRRESGDDLVGIVPGPVEPPVDHPLHPPAQRVEQRRDDQRRARHHDRR